MQSLARRQIVAFGGGGFSMESGNPLLDEYVLGLAAAIRDRPRVCFLPSASGDADHYIVRFYRAFSPARCEPSHVSLFRRERGAVTEFRAHLLAQDLIYVGGGSVISLLGVWRAHGLDEILRECWEVGILLCGLSAGSLCWFTEGLTAFHGTPSPVHGLGLLPGSNAVHCRCASSSLLRTPSTWAAARWSTCSRSGGRRVSTRSCARRGRRGSCSPG